MGIDFMQLGEEGGASLEEATVWIEMGFQRPGFWLYSRLQGQSIPVTFGEEALIALGRSFSTDWTPGSLYKEEEKHGGLAKPEELTEEQLALKAAYEADPEWILKQRMQQVNGAIPKGY